MGECKGILSEVAFLTECVIKPGSKDLTRKGYQPHGAMWATYNAGTTRGARVPGWGVDGSRHGGSRSKPGKARSHLKM